MIVTSVSEGGAQPGRASGTFDVRAAAGESPLRVYRRVLLLRLAPAGAADRVVIEQSAAGETAPRLRGAFQPLDFDPLVAPEAALRASVEGREGAIVVTLGEPREVRAVRLRPDPGHGVVELHRVDGEAIADEPSHSLRGFSLAASQAAAQVAVQLSARTGGPRLPGSQRFQPELGLQAEAVLGPAGSAEPFVSHLFAARLRLGGSAVALTASDVDSLTVRGRPTGPRLGLAPPGRPEEAVFFWQRAGEIGGTLPASEGEVNAGEAVAAALQAHLDERLDAAAEGGEPEGASPGALEVALVVESDAPCRFRLDQLQLVYHFEIESFPEGEPKRSLRFSGEGLDSHDLELALPAGTDVVAARLRLAESLGGDRLDGGSSGSRPGSGKKGVLLAGARSTARRIELPAASLVTGVALGLLALEAASTIDVSIETDADGRPSGEAIAAGSLRLEAAGSSRLAAIRFAEPVILSTVPYWLVARAAAGTAVWLAAEGDGSVRLIERPSPLDSWATIGAVAGLETSFRLLRRGGSAAAAGPLEVTLGGLAVGESGSEEGVTTFNLTSPLRAALESGAEVGATVTISSAIPGSVTVYPPRIRYDLP